MCDTPNSLRDENKHLVRVFRKNNYNADFSNLNETFTDLRRSEQEPSTC